MRQIEIGIPIQERAHGAMRFDEIIDNICQGWSAARTNASRGPGFERSFHRRFQITHKPSANKSRLCWVAPPSFLLTCPERRLLHRTQINTGSRREMVQAFSHAPRIVCQSLGAEFFVQSGNQRACVLLNCVKLILEIPYVGWRHMNSLWLMSGGRALRKTRLRHPNMIKIHSESRRKWLN